MLRRRGRLCGARTSKLDPFKARSPNGWRRTRTSRPPSSSSGCVRSVIPADTASCRSMCTKCVRNCNRRAFVRMEPPAGERFEVDWGHFGALDYSGDPRKLYAFALVEAHSRMLYVEFTHSQSFETFARCHIHAFTAMGGVAREIAYDNLATAVAEHDGRPGPLSSAIPRLRPRIWLLFRMPATRRRLGKRKSRTRHRIRPPELLAAAPVHRSARCESTGAAVAGRDRQSAPASRNTRAPHDRFKAEALRPLPVIPYDHRDPPRPWFTKISACSSMATAIASLTAMSAAASFSKRIPARSPSMTASTKSSLMPARGAAARPSAPTGSKRGWLTYVLRPSGRARSNVFSPFSMESALRPAGRLST